MLVLRPQGKQKRRDEHRKEHPDPAQRLVAVFDRDVREPIPDKPQPAPDPVCAQVVASSYSNPTCVTFVAWRVGKMRVDLVRHL
jgi:hypothetical protein